MKYITIADLSETIRKNLWKIPHDIDFIIGVPRSGMISASMIASYLNTPLIDVNSYLAGMEPWGGGRLGNFKRSHVNTGKILVVEDTVYFGNSLRETKDKISKSGKPGEYTYMCVYLEGPGHKIPDLYLEDVRHCITKTCPIVLYEWNIFQHHDFMTTKFLFDMDGVLCVDPPDERNEKEYLEFIKNAPPLFIPLSLIGGIITYRLVKNKDITIDWLKNHNIRYNTITMFDANSWEERNSKGISPEQYKAQIYKNSPQYILFVESSDYQAQRICELSGKPVYSVETNRLYQK